MNKKSYDNISSRMNVHRNKDFYTEEQVAKKLNISIYTLRHWYRMYKKNVKKFSEDLRCTIPTLPPKVKIGRFKYFLISDLDKLKEFKNFYKNQGFGLFRGNYRAKNKRGFGTKRSKK